MAERDDGPDGGAVDQRIILSPRWQLPESLLKKRRQVALITAPAGFGKSTLITRWATEAQARGAVSLQVRVHPDDLDGDQLVLDLATAFSPADDERSRMLSGGMGRDGRHALIAMLETELGASRTPSVLFIDDAHFLSDAAAAFIFRMLVTHQSSSLGVVISSRRDHEPHLNEALLEGRIVRLGPKQLAFDHSEVGELLHQHGVAPSQALVEQVAKSSGGWPAIVRLTAITLQESGEGDDGFLDGLVGGLLDRSNVLTSYLFEALLSRLPPRTATFLLGLSLLSRFNIELAGCLTGMDDAPRLLGELRARALPITSSGDSTLPIGMHALVRQFLLAHYRQHDPEGVRAAAARAQAWLLSHDRVDVAIDLNLDIGDVDGAAALIDRFARQTMRHYGVHITFLRWCNKIPRSQLQRFPRVRLLQVWTLNILRRHDEADAILDELDRQLSSLPAAEKQSREALRQLVDLEHCVRLVVRDHWLPLELTAGSWIERWGNNDKAEALHRGMAYVMKGCGNASRSHFDEALQHIRIGRDLIGKSQAHYCMAWTQMWMVAILTKKGQYRQALAECDEAIALIGRHLGGRTPAELMLQAPRSLLLYEYNRLDEASEALEKGLTALVEQSSVDSQIAGYVTVARISAARGQHLEADSILAEGENLGKRHDLPRLAVALAAERIDLLLRRRQLGPAVKMWQELRALVDSSALRSAERMIGERVLSDKVGRIEARMKLLEGDAAAALALLEPGIVRAQARGQKHKLVEMLLLKVLACQQLQQHDQADSLLQDAVDIGIVEGYVRVFADESPELKPRLLAVLEHTTAPALRTYIRLLTEAFPAVSGDSDQLRRDGCGTGLSEALTPRELKIVRRLSSGLNNRELASTLFITEGTLKWHLKNIYGKLGVTNRVSAINALKALGLDQE